MTDPNATLDGLRRTVDDLYKRGIDATGGERTLLLEAAARLGEVIPDAPEEPCALTGRRAEGFARLANGLRLSHGQLDDRPTPWERYQTGGRVTIPIKKIGNQIVAVLASASDDGGWDPNGPDRGGEALVSRYDLRNGSTLIVDYDEQARPFIAGTGGA